MLSLRAGRQGLADGPQLIVGLKGEYDSLSNDGFRVLAVATKELPGKQSAQRKTRETWC